MSQLRSAPAPSHVTTANGTKMPVVATGCTPISANKELSEVLYIPSMTRNLLSVGKLTDQGNTVLFSSDHCYVVNNRTKAVLLKVSRDPSSKLYKLNVPDIPSRPNSPHSSHLLPHFKLASQCNYAASPLSLTDRWHQRLGHSNHQRIRHMLSHKLVLGVPHLPNVSHVCEACIKGKHSRHRIPKQATNRATRPLELIHSDLCGPFPASLTGSRYFITFTDDFSRFTWVYFLKLKSEALEKFKVFKLYIETTLGSKIRSLRSDRGGEYMSDLFKSFCQQHGITRQLTVAKTPHQNGVAERKNRTLLDILRSMAITSQAPAPLWEEYLNTANYVNNRCSTRALNLATPFECITSRKPDLSHLRIIGSIAYVHIPKDMRTKLDPKSFSTILVGYDQHSKAYRCFDPSTNKILISKDVIFDEGTMGNFSPNRAPTQTLFDILSTEDDHVSPAPAAPRPQHHDLAPLDNSTAADADHGPMDSLDDSPEAAAADSPTAADAPPDAAIVNTPHLPTPAPGIPPRPRSIRLTSRPYKLSDYHVYLASQHPDLCMALLAHSTSDVDLNNAFSDPNWCAAMQTEIDAHSRNSTWDLTPLPSRAKALSAKWVLKEKNRPEGGEEVQSSSSGPWK